jgi:hypothetical protein
MKYLVIIFSLTLSYAYSCVEETSLYGESVYSGKDPEIVYVQVEKTWNANSEIYDSLYLNSKSRPEDIHFIILKKNKSFFSKRINIKKSTKENTYKISNLSFKKDLVARNQDFPFIAKFEYRRGGKSYCTQSVQFMVTE